ncbi:Flp pilus assembly protein TadG [Constrictibacter sp. MBR-5]|jgi:Flp pilus assembly protein TadG|uniref:TadE/TadG family type IV pilus assembly protein n=1 Tax=Constrictibacter sp. MBR-5 TaxID=3156467 RepID=UPI00339507AB
MIAFLRARLRRACRALPPNLGERGVAAVETAIVIPILVILLIGVAEVGSKILTGHKLNTTASRVGDLVTQQQMVTQAGLDDIFAAVEHIAGESFDDHGVVIISAVTGTDGSPVVAWQRRGAGTLQEPSHVGAAGAVAQLPGDFTVADGETVIVVEVIVANGGVVADLMTPHSVIAKTSLHRGRINDLGSITGS